MLVVWEGMEWARLSNQRILFIKIDFKKSYDKIEWIFILTMLEALCFGSYFISTMHMLFQDAFVVLSLYNL